MSIEESLLQGFYKPLVNIHVSAITSGGPTKPNQSENFFYLQSILRMWHCSRRHMGQCRSVLPYTRCDFITKNVSLELFLLISFLYICFHWTFHDFFEWFLPSQGTVLQNVPNPEDFTNYKGLLHHDYNAHCKNT